MKCMNCGKEFESKRATAKYCSAKCRKLAFQNDEVSVPENAKSDIVENAKKPANYGQEDCECMHCQSKRTNKSNNIINHTGKPMAGQIMRQPLPGDVDYDGCMVKGEDGQWRQKQTKPAEPQPIDLPDCVPDVIKQRYQRNEPEYVKVINNLLTHSLAQLNQQGVMIPVWREQAGEKIVHPL